MKLLVAIPALNEEESIGPIIERSLAARAHILAGSIVDQVDITVVSDGSTDRTVERATAYGDRIKLIVFPRNRGYGAAIQEAWAQSDADLLAFLDADGTCDPRFFRDLCDLLHRENADIVLGCRLNAGSKMPLVRRTGNVLFARLLATLSKRSVRDTASGMRVLRRSVLPALLPLPTGLHFTPAMSAKALLGEGVRLAEIDMPYEEREGRSKLHAVKDGIRFLRAILEAAFLYRPSRPLTILALLAIAAAAAIMASPILHYARTRTVAEWMIYRFVVSEVLGLVGVLLICASHLSRRMVRISLPGLASPSTPTLDRLLFGRFFWVWTFLLFAAGALLVGTSWMTYLATRHVFDHWSRFIVMSFFVLSGCALVVTRLVDLVLGLVESHLAYLRSRVSP